MRFLVLPVGGQPDLRLSETAFLISDNWNDYWEFQTQYYLAVNDRNGVPHDIGQVKIGQFSWAEGQTRPEIPEFFESVDDRFFSLGQDISYYEALQSLPYADQMAVLRGLRDMALDTALFRRASSERVTNVSLLRSVAPTTVTGQFNRVIHGGAKLSKYNFAFNVRTADPSGDKSLSLHFAVTPNSNPPTNIHVLIGRNGVGKTRLLGMFREGLIRNQARAAARVTEGDSSRGAIFANLVSVSFSAFDTFDLTSDLHFDTDQVRYNYVGLRAQNKVHQEAATKTAESLAWEFGNSVRICLRGARLGRWRRALEKLEADPIFADANISDLADSTPDLDDNDNDELRAQAVQLFSRLSSGHKIVLLTITRLVELVEEQTMVLIDEPEAHLHPPLLSAFVRALSDLLINRNGVALVATHSPVVLQEVPGKCVWKLRRVGVQWVFERPQIETFGENVGVLTQEIFGLEVSQSGFHRMLQAAVDSGMTASEVFEHFDNEIGGEGRSIVRGLIAIRDSAS